MIHARHVTPPLLALALCAQATLASAQHHHRGREARPRPAADTPPAGVSGLTATTPPLPAAAVQPNVATSQPGPTTADLEAVHVQGIELRRQHRDAEARDLFRELYVRTNQPRVLAWLAGAEGALGDWINAEAHLSTALESTSDPWISQLRDELASDLAGFRQRLGLVEITSDTPHAEVVIAGEATALPLQRPIAVRAGEVRVEVRAEGYLTEVRTLQVAGGMRSPAREVVNLTARPATPPVGTAPTQTITRTVVVEETGVHPLRIVGAVLAGVGAVGIGIGIYGMVHYSSLRDDYVSAGCDVANPPADCAGFDTSGALTLGVASLASGGVFVAGGLTLLLIPLQRGRRPVSVSAGPGDVGLSLRGTF